MDILSGYNKLSKKTNNIYILLYELVIKFEVFLLRNFD